MYNLNTKIKSAYNANCYFLADESLKLRDVTTSHFSSMEVSEISDITFKRSVHFTSPPSTVPLCHLIKQNTYRLKTKKNMWEGLDFLPHHISAQHPGWSDQHRKVTNRSHAVWKQSRQCRCAHQKQVCSSKAGGIDEFRQLSAQMGLLWDQMRRAFLLPHLLHQYKPLHTLC